MLLIGLIALAFQSIANWIGKKNSEKPGEQWRHCREQGERKELRNPGERPGLGEHQGRRERQALETAALMRIGAEQRERQKQREQEEKARREQRERRSQALQERLRADEEQAVRDFEARVAAAIEELGTWGNVEEPHEKRRVLRAACFDSGVIDCAVRRTTVLRQSDRW
jgi:flagellar motility protein MotE (MotC chaperone)